MDSHIKFPEFLLKAFANSNTGQVCWLNSKDGSVIYANPNSFNVTKDYYTKDNEMILDRFCETHIAKLARKLGKAIKGNVVSNTLINKKDQDHIYNLFSYQNVRNPIFINHILSKIVEKKLY